MKKFRVLFVFLVVVFLISTSSCKKETFNIAGLWNGSLNFTGYGSYTASFNFAGSEASGTATITVTGLGTLSGTYTVTDLSVNIQSTWQVSNPATNTMNGTASEDFNTMNGSFTQSNGFNGTWNASR